MNGYQDPEHIRKVIHEELTQLAAEHAHREQEMTTLRQDHADGFKLDYDAALKRIKRYEADAYRRYLRAMKALSKLKAKGSPSPKAVPPVEEAKPQVVPTPKAETPLSSPVASPVVPPVPKGNRLQRRKQEAKARHQAHHARAKR